jgi:hypothetical protein
LLLYSFADVALDRAGDWGMGPRTDWRIPMELRTRKRADFARSRPVVECAQCGEELLIPEWSEYLDDRRARHLWCCEACGYSFETTVRFAAA